MNLLPVPDEWKSWILSAFRIVAAAMLIMHGTQKLFGIPASATPLPPIRLFSMLGIAGILETVGGTLLLIGLETRPVAFLLSGELAVAYFTVHARIGLLPIQNQGELAVLYSFLFLYLSAVGGGRWSIDGLLALRRRGEALQGSGAVHHQPRDTLLNKRHRRLD
jgi:putative oxidoreductase